MPCSPFTTDDTDTDDPSQSERYTTALTRNTANMASTLVGKACSDSAPGASSLVEEQTTDVVPESQSMVVSLQESPTEFLVFMPGSVFAEDDAEYEEAKSRNVSFEKTKSKRIEHSGWFKERSAQTFHKSQRNSASETMSPEGRDCGAGFSPHDLDFDKNTEPSLMDSFGEPFTAALTAPAGCLLDVSDGEYPSSSSSNHSEKGNLKSAAAPATIQQVSDDWSKTRILGSSGLATATRTMDLAIQQTFDGSTQLRFLGIPPKGTELIHPSRTEKLFAFHYSESAESRPATTMCFNKSNPHHLAVGYGGTGAEENSGMILLWSLRNFNHPEALIATAAAVCALDYSESRPAIIACGHMNGVIALYDSSRSRASIGMPVAESTCIQGRHQQPVNAVKWVMNGRHEKLISCSSDGKVYLWECKKGLSLTPLMTLNRIGGSGSAISRVAAGLCLSFPLPTATEYVVGTGDGDLIQCSTSYSDGGNVFSEAHTAPILQIKHSPFVKEIFLTCSSDWTAKLWVATSQDDCTSKLELSSANMRCHINDIAWSPTVSTVFALVADDGRIDIYDLSCSVLDAKETIKPSAAEGYLDMKRTTCLFSPDGSTLLAGSSGGKVDVFILPPQLLSHSAGQP